MHDFKAYVRQNLPPLGISDEREAAVVEDLALQLEEVYEAAIARGMTEEEAWVQVARQIPSWRQLGVDLMAIEETAATRLVMRHAPMLEPRKGSILSWAGGLIRDFRLAIRVLVGERGFSATTILTLAVCIGANAAVFTIVYSVLMRPLPMVPESDRILVMANQYPKGNFGMSFTTSSSPDYFDRLKAVTVFEEQAVFNFTDQRIEVADGIVESLHGMVATPSLFRLLRVAPVRGRIFDDSEEKMGNQLKIILTYGLWQQLFGGEDALGRDVRLTGRPYKVVGVMPRGFTFFDPDVRFWITMPWDYSPGATADSSRHNNAWNNIGRLKPGATIEQAQSQVDALNAVNLERFPDSKTVLVNAGFHTTVEPLQTSMVRPVKNALFLLWGGAAFVLLIGGVNILNLTLARSNVRFPELATRVAVGATRRQIARQLFVEGLLLAWSGALSGLGLGFLGLRIFERYGFGRIPRANEIHMDFMVVAFAIGAASVVGILIGLVPLAGLSRVNLGAVLHEKSRTTAGTGKARIVRWAVVTAQIAFTFILVMGAGLLLSSFRHLLAVDPGFSTEGVLTARFNIPMLRYPDDEDARVFSERMMDAVRGVPGVISAGMTTMTPLGGTYNRREAFPQGYALGPGASLMAPMIGVVTPGYFEAMSTSLIEGRYFSAVDTRTSAPVAIVDEKLARKFWTGSSPVGKRLYLPNNPANLVAIDEKTKSYEVVGVVSEVRLEDLTGNRNPAGAFYVPYAQSFTRGYRFAIKSAIDPGSLVSVLRAEVRKVDRETPIFEVRTMREWVDSSLVTRRAGMLLALSFAGIALFLSAVGIYGVLAYLVTQRRREIGIRMALGSTVASIFKLIFFEGLLLVGTGLSLGVVGAVALRGTLANELYGVGPTDPFLIALVATLLGGIALAASVVPARRATRVNPVTVLNQQ